MCYAQEGDEFLDSNVTEDETWVFHHTSESKQQSLHSQDDDEVQEEDMTWFKGQAADFYDSGIQKLVRRLNKSLDNAGDYVENKVMYRQFIQCCFFKLKRLYMFKTFVSLLSGHATYMQNWFMGCATRTMSFTFYGQKF